MKRKTNDMFTFVGVRTSAVVVAILESFGFISHLSKQKQSRFAHTRFAV